MSELNELIASEIADFFAGFGGPGEPDIQNGEAQRLLTGRVLSVLALRERAEPVAWRWRWSDDAEGDWRYTEERRETRGSVTAVPLYTAPPAQPVAVPKTLPCPVLLEPGLRFGKGVHTQIMMDALQRRAEYYAELEAMTQEQRAEHEAGIKEFAAMLAAPGKEG
ncbi:hypothetical protein ACU9F8_000720 [Cronobacter sakazakii]